MYIYICTRYIYIYMTAVGRVPSCDLVFLCPLFSRTHLSVFFCPSHPSEERVVKNAMKTRQDAHEFAAFTHARTHANVYHTRYLVTEYDMIPKNTVFVGEVKSRAKLEDFFSYRR